jgi:hypothetical protein
MNIENSNHAYAESSARTQITTKGQGLKILSYLRDLRVHRGETIYYRIQLAHFRYPNSIFMKFALLNQFFYGTF